MTKAIKKAMSIITAIAVMFMAGFVVLPPVARAETLGAFEVTDVSGMYEYKYENGVLTVLSGSAYYSLSIKNTDPNTPTTDRIEIADGVGSMILYLGGVNIDVSALDDTAAIKVNGSSRLYISVEGGKNTLKSGKNCAGIQLHGTDGEISIDASDVNGLTVTGGEGGADSFPVESTLILNSANSMIRRLGENPTDEKTGDSDETNGADETNGGER